MTHRGRESPGHSGLVLPGTWYLWVGLETDVPWQPHREHLTGNDGRRGTREAGWPEFIFLERRFCWQNSCFASYMGRQANGAGVMGFEPLPCCWPSPRTSSLRPWTLAPTLTRLLQRSWLSFCPFGDLPLIWYMWTLNPFGWNMWEEKKRMQKRTDLKWEEMGREEWRYPCVTDRILSGGVTENPKLTVI